MTNKASGPQLGDSKQRNDRIESTAFFLFLILPLDISSYYAKTTFVFYFRQEFYEFAFLLPEHTPPTLESVRFVTKCYTNFLPFFIKRIWLHEFFNSKRRSFYFYLQ